MRSRSLSVPAAKSACVLCTREASCASSASSRVATALFTCSGFTWADFKACSAFSEGIVPSDVAAVAPVFPIVQTTFDLVADTLIYDAAVEAFTTACCSSEGLTT